MSVDDRPWSKGATRANLVLFLVLAGCSGGGAGSVGNTAQLPNIVLVVMDDIGIDQWQLFGYGSVDPAATPNIDAIANGGVNFHNMWAMPACSNGRAALFTGRYPFRTNVFTAIGNDDLANYMVNPNEITLPKLLKPRGYTSALFGKFHMVIQENDPYGYAMLHALGFDYFDGW
jgi:arylsulfatase A-like enzyme